MECNIGFTQEWGLSQSVRLEVAYEGTTRSS